MDGQRLCEGPHRLDVPLDAQSGFPPAARSKSGHVGKRTPDDGSNGLES